VVRPVGYFKVHTVRHALGIVRHGRDSAANKRRALTNENESSLRVYSTGDLPDVYEDSFMAIANPDGLHKAGY
jgi:hypothetical protein